MKDAIERAHVTPPLSVARALSKSDRWPVDAGVYVVGGDFKTGAFRFAKADGPEEARRIAAALAEESK